uniref:Tetratricopeptide repeat protein n=1 Tax=Roseihalotalea indica TaxID=2867963 RepID=A0AA49GU53_9BACT|nr:tetratricopeptide repeat protein [Tunicatimonas sp. TK19036]
MKASITWIIILLTCANIIQVSAQDTEQIELAQQYDDKGEVEKAKTIYDELVSRKKNITLVHDRYIRLLVNNGFMSEAEKYMDKVLRIYPDNILYQLDAGLVQLRKGDDAEAEKYYTGVFERAQSDPMQVRVVAGHLIKHELVERAVNMYLAGRRASGDPNMYALELANVYRRLNETDKMVQEYLAYANEDPSHISYVKNVLQNILTEEEDLESMSNLLLDKIQQDADNPLYSELLIWINLQQKNFYGAFMQARAVDRRLRTEGDQVMDVAQIALENHDYENALKMYDYIIEKYPRTANYVSARRYKIKAREELVKNQFPVQQEEIVKLIEDYQNFIDESGNSPIGPSAATLEAMRSQALLYAFYMDEKDQAIEILQQVAGNSKSSREMKAQTKLDMGDIYVLMDQPWESTLLYAQVEKAHKEEPVGYEAKLRNAKLSYYKGEFSLAQDHLDVLKEATTREIANDAMSLSLLIQNNTVLDTSGAAMQAYADVELMLFQNKQQPALTKLDSMLSKYQGHPLEDEIYWLMAKVYLQLGSFDESLAKLSKITESYGFDILGDDALFMTGRIYEEQLKDNDKAMELYTQFMREYPGSIYVADVRKRFRSLRGDFNIN